MSSRFSWSLACCEQVPTDFGVTARSLIEASTAHISGLQPVLAVQEKRLDIMVIAAAGKGTVIVSVHTYTLTLCLHVRFRRSQKFKRMCRRL